MQQAQIHIRGHIDSSWQEWFEGFTIRNDDGGQAVITGTIHDQTGLYALLNRLERLGIQLISVEVTDIPGK